MTTAKTAAAPAEKTFLGQPRGLVHLFGVEMWERFSFYGMQAILLYYLSYSVADGGLGITTSTAASIVGAYGGTVYLSTIVGGWVADRLLGPERVLFWSAVVVMAGHVALSLVPGLAGVGVGLVLIALGSGGVKATATTLVGLLYSADDVRRDAGFSVFYLGINVGALAGPLLTGLAQSTVGFHLGFGLAAVGMAAGLVQYAVGRRGLEGTGREVPSPLPAAERARWISGAAVGVLLLVGLALTGVIRAERLATIVVWVCVVVSIGYFAQLLRSARIDRTERRRVLAFIPMFVASVAFWSLYQQQSTVVALYADSQLDRDLFGWTVPASWVQSINPVFIILLSGVFAALWTRLGPRQPSTPVKFAAGTAIMGLAFLLFLPMAGSGPGGAPLLGLVGVLLVFTVAELLLSPVGLSLSTKLAPAAYRTQMVALWFLSTAIGTSLAGVFAGKYDPDTQVAYFGTLGGIAVVLGLVLALATPFIRRLMSGVR
ncbi:proton-dependent oligopeptide transporter, POT family [Klenkia soli]|uniref:Proton-dependent oligopeptide transporter, POT family n=1 Tax=Klenkia soli TaxID=1052260 RepID=A0A1H0MAZ3_9ACTN|nr:peptide MFS transporter [Klenkia soli]SDO77602.1 proton-dependent oligopeptide transporter, POT family [Klenkia soli]